MTTRNNVPLEEEEPHTTHTIKWGWSDNKLGLTCNKAQTVLALLNQSSVFKRTAEKVKHKELVIVRGGKAISHHFPCCLLENGEISLKSVKATNKPKKPVSSSVLSSKRLSRDHVMFDVFVKGGKNVARIMRNPELARLVQEVTVYAYKGEKVKHALKRDGRFLDIVFHKTCALSNIVSEEMIEMSNLVDDLKGQRFKIILLSKSSPPESQPSSLEEIYLSESQRSGLDETPHQATTAQPKHENKATVGPKMKQDKTSKKISHILPDSRNLQNQLASQFKCFLKSRKTPVSKLSQIQNLMRVEYGQNAQICKEVKTMKKLMELSDSVCQVRINETPIGSGFLLFGEFVLTNAHVVKDVYNVDWRQLNAHVTVHFAFESLGEGDGGREEVEEVVGFEFQPDVSGCDWALLKIRAERKLPDGLLSHFGFLPQGGGICIIGHPNEGVKKVDPCVIVPHESQTQVVKRHYHENQDQVQLITSKFFENALELFSKRKGDLFYESCFYCGSSGSPVFDQYGRVVAMHTGGYVYHTTRGQTESVIEYGQPLSTIMERMIIQTVEIQRLDVLKKYLAFKGKEYENILANVKKLVESRNLTSFREAACSQVTMEDSILKEFFQWVLQKEEPVSMEI